MSLLHATLLIVVLLGGLGAAAAGLAALPGWRHQSQRFLFTAVGAMASLAVAVLAGDALLSGTRPAGWRAPLHLLADAMLPLALVLLIQAYRRADLASLKAQAAAPISLQTSLPNRAALIGQAIPALARCRRDQGPAAVVAVAIDGLDRIARDRGPKAAQDSMRQFSTMVCDTLRAGDVLGHATPHVLAALLPSATAEGAGMMAERLRSAASARLAHPDMDGRRLSLSVGVAPVGEGPNQAVLDEALAAAEAALAAAQAEGGDRVITAPPPPLRSARPPDAG